MTNRQRTTQKLSLPITRLSMTMRKQIYRWIISGESDAAIQVFLRDVGFPAVSETTLIRYRGRAFVLRAITAREDAGMQEGFARFDVRMRELTRSAQLLSRMLHTMPSEGAPPARAGSEPTALSRELRGILAEIEAQTHRRETRRAANDKRKGTKEESGEESGGVLLLPDNGRVPDVPCGSD